MRLVGNVSRIERDSAGTSTSGARARTGKVLPASFFDRDPVTAARELLGKLLVRKDARGLRAGRIVEVEAYLGTDDPAAHSAAGKTARNAVIFGPPGRAYVYFIYGMYFCMNITCLGEGDAGCLLLRSLEPVEGFELMAAARRLEATASLTIGRLRQLTTGPGRLCAALEITRERDNGKDLCRPASDLQVIDDGFAAGAIVTTPRIGITRAAERPLRFCLAESPFLSGRPILA
jgi:DNA-3-methyladenine glycosylase